MITSEAVHEAVVKAFVAAGFNKIGDCNYGSDIGAGVLGVSIRIAGGVIEKPLTLQQLFTAENGLQWPDWAVDIRTDDHCVWFDGVGRADVISGDWSPVKSRVLAIRQPKEKEVKTIEDAVIAKSGKWDSSKEYIQWCGDGWMFHDVNELWQRTDEYPYFYHGAFAAEAKRLGYINGYRWVVEYPTNGKRPELADDVLVVVNSGANAYLGGVKSFSKKWPESKSFCITDERYKPSDKGYINAQPQDQSLTHSEEGLTHSWHERGELPPVGVDCEYSIGHVWYNCYIKCHVESDGVRVAIFQGKNHWGGCIADRFRPIRTEREKFIEAATSVFYNGEYCERMAAALFDAGFRGPKMEKSQ